MANPKETKSNPMKFKPNKPSKQQINQPIKGNTKHKAQSKINTNSTNPHQQTSTKQ